VDPKRLSERMVAARNKYFWRWRSGGFDKKPSRQRRPIESGTLFVDWIGLERCRYGVTESVEDWKDVYYNTVLGAVTF
jgi:hypothetical protein